MTRIELKLIIVSNTIISSDQVIVNSSQPLHINDNKNIKDLEEIIDNIVIMRVSANFSVYRKDFPAK